MKVLVTGSAGFIGWYLVEQLLSLGHEIVGIDNDSNYHAGQKNHVNRFKVRFVKGDVKNRVLMKELLSDCDHLVAMAAKVGGVGYINKHGYDILSENEKITASTFDAAIYAHKRKRLQKITVISSSMVYERAKKFPTKESALLSSPPPRSSYGLQKLAAEYFAKAAWEQYGLPYTIVRPFNCVGIGEMASEVSHVIPDLVAKVLKGQSPLDILGDGSQIRHFTYVKDLAKAISICIFSAKAKNEDFNIASYKSTTILELAKLIWKKIRPGVPFRYKELDSYRYDVKKRIPDTRKAKKILGIVCETPLETMLEEVIPWLEKQIEYRKNI